MFKGKTMRAFRIIIDNCILQSMSFWTVFLLLKLDLRQNIRKVAAKSHLLVLDCALVSHSSTRRVQRNQDEWEAAVNASKTDGIFGLMFGTWNMSTYVNSMNSPHTIETINSKEDPQYLRVREHAVFIPLRRRSAFKH